MDVINIIKILEMAKPYCKNAYADGVSIEREINEVIKQLNRHHGFEFWMGGEQPEPDGTPIEVIYRNGDRVTTTAGSSQAFDWNIGNQGIGGYDGMDIIAYRVIEDKLTGGEHPTEQQED